MPKIAEKEQDFSAILASAGMGMTLQIKRLQPTWCDGILCEEEIDPNDPVDLEHIREQWGGRKLTLTLRKNGVYKASTTLKFPDQPKKHSVLEVNPNEIAAIQQPPAPPPQDNKLFEIMIAMQKQQSDTLAAVQQQAADTIKEAQAITAAAQQSTLENQISELKNQITDMKTAEPAPVPKDKLSALDTIKEAAETLKEVQGLQGLMGGEGGDSTQFNFLSDGIKQVMEMFMQQKKMEMEMLIEKRKEEGGRPKPPPLEDRTEQIPGTTADATAIPANVEGLGQMLNAFQAMPVSQQAQLVSAHIEQLDEDQRVEFLSTLANSDFIEEEDDDEPKTEPTENNVMDIQTDQS